jgi:hypothetical protein
VCVSPYNPQQAHTGLLGWGVDQKHNPTHLAHHITTGAHGIHCCDFIVTATAIAPPSPQERKCGPSQNAASGVGRGAGVGRKSRDRSLPM